MPYLVVVVAKGMAALLLMGRPAHTVDPTTQRQGGAGWLAPCLLRGIVIRRSCLVPVRLSPLRATCGP